ncbi:MAG TPA: glycosyltransferase [Nocardioidaceae bacterium]|jgi:glycosyltransferase involved in cell wall biosynthesis|nr:glycosyltransferase [Nocardioidaceae bacterium]
MKIDLVSEHASPLAALGSVDAGGQNVHVAALAAGLVQRGHQVTVCTRRDDPDVPDEVLVPDGYVVAHLSAGPPTDVPKDDLLPHVPDLADRLHERWSTQRPDLVHSHFWMSGLAASAAARTLGIPLVQTFHALGTVKRRHQAARDTSPTDRIALEAQLCGAVDHVIATCRDEVAELTAMGLARRRVSVVPCGVDTDHFTPTPQPRNVPPRLLVVGRLVERKGIGDVVAALPALPEVELLVAGGPSSGGLTLDPEARRLQELAQTLGVADRVRLLGSVDHAEVPGLIGSVDVVVTVPWYEPFGIVPLEAMACGRPVVASAVGGLQDTVVPGSCGELVPPRRPDLLADTLRSLLADEGRRAAYGEAGLQRVRDHYRWDRVCAETERVYASVLRRVTAAAGAAGANR